MFEPWNDRARKCRPNCRCRFVTNVRRSAGKNPDARKGVVPVKAYLAGPITGKTFGDATEWREYVAMRLAGYGIEALSPMRGKDFILKRIGTEKVLDQTYDAPMSKQKAILNRDRWDVMNADVVLFNLLPYAVTENGCTKASIGTCVEFGWADAFRKLCVVVLDETDAQNPHNHAFLKEIAAFVVPTVDDAIEIIRVLNATMQKVPSWQEVRT